MQENLGTKKGILPLKQGLLTMKRENMGEGSEKNGWNEWSRHIIGAIERLDKQLETLRDELNKANLDIAKLSYLNTSLVEIEKKLMHIREDVISQDDEMREAVVALENDDAANLNKVEKTLEELNVRIDKIDIYLARIKTVAWIIGVVLAAVAGTLSFSLSDFFK